MTEPNHPVCVFLCVGSLESTKQFVDPIFKKNADMIRKILTTLLFLIPTGVLHADFVVSVIDGDAISYTAGSATTPVVMPGGTVKLGIWVHDTEGPGRTLSGYNLAFDLAEPGKGFNTTWFSQVAATANPSLNGGFNIAATNASTDSSITYDYVVGATGSLAIPATATPVKLFDISFSVANATQTGVYNFAFVSNAQFRNFFGELVPTNSLTTSSGGAFSNLISTGGQFQVVAVPEPTSMALVGVVALAGLGVKRFRRRIGKSD